ncbi:MAG TPA: peptidoglycan-binding domain-containing protein [Bryobacteraceae bacterium]|nr:peptidoglycan-binding domain-containing protein [Bryobacteraceae bacterium]
MTLRRGSAGDSVLAVQTRLRELKLYTGPLDGQYGGGTEAAVKCFQRTHNLDLNGEVGPATWSQMFPDQPRPANDLLSCPVDQRCLALTGSFETCCAPPDCFCGLAGDFDGQGMSFGALQWNIGQGTLQPLLACFVKEHPKTADDIFHEHLAQLQRMLGGKLPEQLAFARSLQDRRHRFLEPWRGMFAALGRTPEFRAIQADAAKVVFNRARTLASDYGLSSERGTALMFDILTQNGSISAAVKAAIMRDCAGLPATLSATEREVQRMRIIARRRAAVARAQYRDDVLNRKMTIAEGTGTVHNLRYDLAEQFGLTLDPVSPVVRA